MYFIGLLQWKYRVQLNEKSVYIIMVYIACTLPNEIVQFVLPLYKIFQIHQWNAMYLHQNVFDVSKNIMKNIMARLS